MSANPTLTNQLELFAKASEAATGFYEKALTNMRARLMTDGKVNGALLDAEQHAAHGLAWVATYTEALKQLNEYASRISGEGRYGEIEALICQMGFSEYLAQLAGGIPMSQGEMIRPHELGLSADDISEFTGSDAVANLINNGNTASLRTKLIELIQHQQGISNLRRYRPGGNLRNHPR